MICLKKQCSVCFFVPEKLPFSNKRTSNWQKEASILQVGVPDLPNLLARILTFLQCQKWQFGRSESQFMSVFEWFSARNRQRSYLSAGGCIKQICLFSACYGDLSQKSQISQGFLRQRHRKELKRVKYQH